MTAASVTEEEYKWVANDRAFAALLGRLEGQPRIGLDTEFHRERTYWPEVALVQLSWDDGVALVDALAVDLTPMAPLLRSETTLVLHAAIQDLEVLRQSTGQVPAHLFDTQIAAAFIGMSSPSLAALCRRFVGVDLAKGDRLTDWKRRPLSADAMAYAASDVRHLFSLHDQLTADLETRGRLDWALDECNLLLLRSIVDAPPEHAWWRVKEARKLRGRAAAIAQEVAAWREERARRVDRPLRFVLPDLAIVAVAQRPPDSIDALRRIRGLDDRHLRGDGAEELLAAIRRGQELPQSAVTQPEVVSIIPELRAAVTLVSAWVSQLAHELELDPTMIAPRAEIEAFVAGTPSALDLGWRHELVARRARRLMDGDAALAFGEAGQLVLEERSRTPLD